MNKRRYAVARWAVCLCILLPAIFRTEKDALGTIKVTGPPRRDIYHSVK